MGTTSLCSSKIAAASFPTSILESSKSRFGCLERSSGKVFASRRGSYGSDNRGGLVVVDESMIFASGRGSYGSDNRGGLVDESMIVLRKRIREMKVTERNYEPPAEWMDWEK